MPRRQFYISEEPALESETYLGSAPSNFPLIKGCHGSIHQSYAYGCPECGEIWARLPVTNDNDQTLPWAFREYPCPKHGKADATWRIPGILYFFMVPFHEMPEAALHRDVGLILDHVETHGLETVFI